MSLNELPSELLDQILWSERSFLVVELWKCGDKLLNHRLANGGCTQVSLADDRVYSKSRYPTMLRELRQLRSLNIRRPRGSLMGPKLLFRELQLLTPLLESLTLESNDAVSSLLNYGKPLPKTPHLWPLVSTQYLRGTSNFWDLQSFFPRLQTLGVFEGSFTAANYAGDDFAGLPSTLTSFKAPTARIGGDYCRLTCLPEHLQELEAASSNSENRVLLPPSLTNILLHPTLHCPNIADMAALPRGLTGTIEIDSPVPDTLHHLPPTITKLCIEDGYLSSPTLQGQWPPHLTEISISQHILFRSTWTASTLRILPRTLKILDLGAEFNDWKGVRDDLAAGKECWPPRLSELSICFHDDTAETYEDKFFSLMPRTATTVRCRMFGQYYPEPINLQLLPTGLRSLVVQFRFCPTPPDWVAYQPLPRSLTVLELGGVSKFISPHPLPETLKILALNHSAERDFIPEQLIWPSQWALAEISLCCRLSAQFLSSLPPSLERLTFRGYALDESREKLTKADLDALERSLHHLKMLRSLCISVDELPGAVTAALPRSLRELRLKIKDLSDADIANLPKQLRSIDLKPSKDVILTCTTKGYIQHWPVNAPQSKDFVNMIAIREARDEAASSSPSQS